MIKILLIDSTYPINTRNERILSSLKKLLGEAADVRLLVWNRDASEVAVSGFHTYVYNEAAAYGNALAKLLKLKGFGDYIRNVNKEFKPDYIIASHWEVLLLASRVTGKGQHLIYENLDMPTAGNPLVLKVLQAIERRSLKKTSAIIHASRFYPDKYRFFPGKQILVENRPQRAAVTATDVQTIVEGRLKVAFIGILRYFDVLKNLIDAAENLPVDILFYGDGPDMGRLREYTTGKEYVQFFGRYKYEEIAGIYASVDLIWAVYPSDDYNVKYAISNKFFESMMLNKPAVFAENTELGKMVLSKGTGFAVNPYDKTAIRELLQHVTSDLSRLNAMNQNIAASGEKLYWEDEDQRLLELFN
ncbi:glycosyltransferase [Chitinophaga rhizophila]|uniref:Glycosyltransferase n=1 Tax=Chitinophaga rhizophila TaxID=2866212 RepID=A0ABS7GGK3_9BACT|nr:glycosyltransferase [Chitinophaga rhizophila]MBW8686446.1 glycosyltransferase [Chitinophaga rhizophila]